MLHYTYIMLLVQYVVSTSTFEKKGWGSRSFPVLGTTFLKDKFKLKTICIRLLHFELAIVYIDIYYSQVLLLLCMLGQSIYRMSTHKML